MIDRCVELFCLILLFQGLSKSEQNMLLTTIQVHILCEARCYPADPPFDSPFTTVLFKNQCKTTKSSISHYHIIFSISFELRHEKACPYANNKGADQPAHPCSLISTSVIRCLYSIIPLISISKISSL